MTQEKTCELLDLYGDTVMRTAYTYLKNKPDAEDAVQEVFLHIIEKNPVFNDKNHEKAWILRTTINVCKNNLNTFWNRNKQSIDDSPDVAVYDSYNTDSSVLKAVMSLPEKYRITIYMYYYEEYSTAEIAKITGKNDVTVRSLLRRARAKLKDMRKEEYDFE